jgi:signal transduction histidine kinase
MPDFSSFICSTGASGKSVLNLAYPIVYNGRIIGYTWANVTTDDAEREMWLLLGRLGGLVVLLRLVTLLGLRYIFAKLANARRQLLLQIKCGDDSPAHFAEFPELVPLLETVGELRRSLRQKHEDKERISREMARLDRLNLIGEMAAGVAHEIRNPMTVVRGYIQRMLQRSPADGRQQLEIVLAEVDRINGIITDFLTLARNKRINRGRHDLNAIVRGLYPLLTAESNMHSLCLELELAEERTDVLIDEGEIKQLILNLARNAIEATGGKGTVIINTEDRQDFVRMRVTDDGRGIHSDFLHKVFDPFFTTKDDNTGLGLAICKSIVDRHGGQITVESQTGVGTTVTVCLPKVA